MKINCGETGREQTFRLTNWHRWFAWRPVRVGSHDCRWLEYIERRGELSYDDWDWFYRPIK